jgi:ubiquinone/menaquinone biosynthesis C-methylase UbiE
MENFDRKKHWENIYQTKQLNEVSWFQPTPETSLNFFKELNVPTSAKIIDIGGGDSFLVDHLLDLGYTDITVLDISETSLDRAKKRLGDRANMVKWLIADAASFNPTEQYDFWHDRAAFHFLTTQQDIDNYVSTVRKNISPNGYLVIGTFSDQGPTKCSGIEIKQYTEKELTELFSSHFDKLKCFTIDHQTPSNNIQNFIFCSFKRSALK